MKDKIELLIVASVLFCLSFVQVAGADTCIKTLYIDGVQVDQKIVGDGLTWPRDRITIGSEGDQWYIYNEYFGKMDEFAVYEGVMNGTRVKAHYDANSNYDDYKTEVQADDPLLWLKFEDASTAHGQVATNSGSETARNGEYIVNGSGSIAIVTGMNAESNGIEFVGPASPNAPGSCIDVWDAGEFSTQTNGDVSIELWVNFEDTNDYPRFFQHNNGWDVFGGYGISVSGPNQIVVNGGGTANFVTRPPGSYLNDGQWHHIVVTYDSTYIPIPTGLYPVEVLADHPVLYLQFEQSPLVDSSGRNCWVGASPLAQVERPVGAMGNAIHLNGGWVAAANSLTEPCLPTQYGNQYAFTPDGNSDITFEFWTMTPLPGSVDAYAELFNDCNTIETIGEDENPVYRPCATRGDTKMKICLADTDGTDPYAYTNGGAWIADTNWHHNVVIWDEQPESDSIHVLWYTDGVNYKDSTYTGITARGWRLNSGPAMDHLIIGGLGSRDNFSPGPGVAYREYMDEFAVYAGILPLNRIRAHYAAWKPKNCAELWDRGYGGSVVGDMDENCKVDFKDFAKLALDWATYADPNDPNTWNNVN